MIILGIDPGTARMGYGVIEYSGNVIPKVLESSVIETKPDIDMHHRLKVLYKNINSIVKAHTPEVVVIEKLFFNTNAKTAIAVGQARGIVMLSAANKNLQMFEYTALEAKMVLTGYGRSNKKQMQEAVKEVLKLKEIVKPDDANDALAMALCFLKKDYESLLALNKGKYKENAYIKRSNKVR